MIRNYEEFVQALLKAGFSMSGKSDGVFSLIDFNWDEEPAGSPIHWHTGNPDTDPWEWRMRVLNERDDILYGKVFFKKAGYMTRETLPLFIAARNAARPFHQQYEDGLLSFEAKRIYKTLSENGSLPLEEIKAKAGFTRDSKSAFDRGLTELQMRLYITMCGRQQRRSQKGDEYGWFSTVLCLMEERFADCVKKAATIERAAAADELAKRVLALNPEADMKKVKKYISG